MIFLKDLYTTEDLEGLREYLFEGKYCTSMRVYRNYKDAESDQDEYIPKLKEGDYIEKFTIISDYGLYPALCARLKEHDYFLWATTCIGKDAWNYVCYEFTHISQY